MTLRAPPGGRGIDPRLANAAVAGYVLLELAVMVYLAVLIARGY